LQRILPDMKGEFIRFAGSWWLVPTRAVVSALAVGGFFAFIRGKTPSLDAIALDIPIIGLLGALCGLSITRVTEQVYSRARHATFAVGALSFAGADFLGTGGIICFMIASAGVILGLYSAGKRAQRGNWRDPATYLGQSREAADQ
jgi:xanthosine utilization system XapX-like protein